MMASFPHEFAEKLIKLANRSTEEIGAERINIIIKLFIIGIDRIVIDAGGSGMEHHKHCCPFYFYLHISPEEIRLWNDPGFKNR